MKRPLHGDARTVWGAPGVALAVWLSAHVPEKWVVRGHRLRISHPSPDNRLILRFLAPHLPHSPRYRAVQRKGGRAAGRKATKRVRERRERLRPYLAWMDKGWSGRAIARALAPRLGVSERTVRSDLQALRDTNGRIYDPNISVSPQEGQVDLGGGARRVSAGG